MDPKLFTLYSIRFTKWFYAKHQSLSSILKPLTRHIVCVRMFSEYFHGSPLSSYLNQVNPHRNLFRIKRCFCILHQRPFPKTKPSDGCLVANRAPLPPRLLFINRAAVLLASVTLPTEATQRADLFPCVAWSLGC